MPCRYLTSQSENFTYDTQNRLTNWNVTRSGKTTYNSMGFDGNGNISQKSDLGAFTLNYGGKNPDGTTTGRSLSRTLSGIGQATVNWARENHRNELNDLNQAM